MTINRYENVKSLHILGQLNCKIRKVIIGLERVTAANSTFAKWRVEEVLVRSIFNLTFVASRQVEVPNPPSRKSANRYTQMCDEIHA